MLQCCCYVVPDPCWILSSGPHITYSPQGRSAASCWARLRTQSARLLPDYVWIIATLLHHFFLLISITTSTPLLHYHYDTITDNLLSRYYISLLPHYFNVATLLLRHNSIITTGFITSSLLLNYCIITMFFITNYYSLLLLGHFQLSHRVQRKTYSRLIQFQLLRQKSEHSAV
jgi:hypothetical protein